MRTILKTFIVILLSVFASTAFSEEIMYCTDNENQVTGFSANKDWEHTLFMEGRHTIKFSGDYKRLTIGDEKYQCQKPYPGLKDEIVCQQNSGYTFIFNPISKKYVKLNCSVFSYTSNGRDTCALAQGTCVRF